MKKKRLIVIGIIVVIMVAVILASYFRNKKDTRVLSLSGNIEVTEANVGFKLPGRIVELAVDEGDTVKAGQLLARLDSAELASVVTQNKASLQEAITKLSELKAGSRIQEIERAQANVSAQAADLEKAKKDVLNKDGKSMMGLSEPILKLKNPGIFSIPLGFAAAILGALAFPSRRAEEMFDEIYVRQNTGIGMAKAIDH